MNKINETIQCPTVQEMPYVLVKTVMHRIYTLRTLVSSQGEAER